MSFMVGELELTHRRLFLIWIWHGSWSNEAEHFAKVEIGWFCVIKLVANIGIKYQGTLRKQRYTSKEIRQWTINGWTPPIMLNIFRDLWGWDNWLYIINSTNLNMLNKIIPHITKIASYYRQLSEENKKKMLRLKPVLLAPRGRRSWLTKLVLFLWFFI